MIVDARGAIPPSPERSAAVDRVMPRNRQQPCLEARIASETVKPRVRGDERLLRDVLGVGRRPERRERGAIYRCLVPVHELSESGRVPVPGAGEQVGVAHTINRQSERAAGWWN